MSHEETLKNTDMDEENGSDTETDDGSIFDTYSESLHLISPPKFCPKCQPIVDSLPQTINTPSEAVRFRLSHHNSIAELKSSASKKCCLCVEFLATDNAQDLPDPLGQETQELHGYVEIDPYTLKGPSGEQPHWQLRWKLERDGTHDDVDMVNLESIRLSVRVLPALMPAKSSNPLGHANTRDGLLQGVRWLKRCCETHRLCNRFSTSLSPTRLIDLSENPRLCLKDQFQHSVQYATLSHCWGSSEHAILTTCSLPIFLDEIPLQSISKTIKHAFEITKTLGIRYLWVDSLCIIQDNADDWAKESALMSTVYGNSTLNIAASGAKDGTIGCFFDRDQAWRCQREIQIARKPQLYDFVSDDLYRHNLSDMPLGRRGWAFQERILSPRTLHFTTTQLFWECHQKIACEIFPDKFPTELSFASVFLQKQPLTRPMWTWIVERYSRCELTYSKDKLIAVSGLARNIQSQSKENYVAGLWREDLELQLCWHKVLDHTGPRYIPYTAPTWSWASIEGAIDFQVTAKPLSREHLCVKVLKVKLGTASVDNLGAITSGSLHLSCDFLLRVEIQEVGHRNAMVLGQALLEVTIYFDYLPVLDEMLFALPVVGIGGVDGIVGLLLQPTQNQGEYERIGVFVFRELDWGTDQSGAFEDAIEREICHAETTDYARIRKDKYDREHRIIVLV